MTFLLLIFLAGTPDRFAGVYPSASACIAQGRAEQARAPWALLTFECRREARA